MNNITPWTKEQIEKLKELHADGTDPEDMVKPLGRPLQGIYKKLQRLGLSEKKQSWTDTQDRLLLQLINSNPPKTFKEIAKQLGRTENAVTRRYYRVVGGGGV